MTEPVAAKCIEHARLAADWYAVVLTFDIDRDREALGDRGRGSFRALCAWVPCSGILRRIMGLRFSTMPA